MKEKTNSSRKGKKLRQWSEIDMENALKECRVNKMQVNEMMWWNKRRVLICEQHEYSKNVKCSTCPQARTVRNSECKYSRISWSWCGACSKCSGISWTAWKSSASGSRYSWIFALAVPNCSQIWTGWSLNVFWIFMNIHAVHK